MHAYIHTYTRCGEGLSHMKTLWPPYGTSSIPLRTYPHTTYNYRVRLHYHYCMNPANHTYVLTVRQGANAYRTAQNNLLHTHTYIRMYVQCQQTATILAMGTLHAYNTSVYSPPTMINMSICGSGVAVCGSGVPVGEGWLVVVGGGEGGVLGGGGGSKPARGQREETRAE